MNIQTSTLLLANRPSDKKHSCRLCGTGLKYTFIDLGMSPPCESFVPRELIDSREAYYPLHAYVCEECLLVQLSEYVSPQAIFEEYAYFSSYSTSWVAPTMTE